MKHISNFFLWILLAGLLTGCLTRQATPPSPVQAGTPAPTATAVQTEISAGEGKSQGVTCQETFERREMKEPYQRYQENQARYTLSTEEFQAYLKVMGLEGMCVPEEFGAPFLNVDWDAAQGLGMNQPAQQGRMISIGFENLYHGGGWGEGYLIYSTYDFVAGTEYDVFASAEDFSRVQQGPGGDIFEAKNGSAVLLGFERVYAGMPLGRTPFFMTYIYPHENDYTGIVVEIGSYEGDKDPWLLKFTARDFPQDRQAIIQLFTTVSRLVKGKAN